MESGSLLAPALGLRRGGALPSDAVEQDTGGFVGWVLRNELAIEGLREDGLIEVFNQFAGTTALVKKTVDPYKSSLNQL